MSQPLPAIVVDNELQAIVWSSTRTIHTRNVTDPTPRKVDEVWEREKVLGRSNATVWLEKCVAGEEMLGKCQAVKEIMTRSPDPVREVARELEAIGRLSQKNYRHCFVRSFGWYKVDSRILITMEYLPLGDLGRYLNNPFPEDEALAITRQLIEGLGFMHSKLGLAHRDLKPENILVQVKAPRWYVKIADFGIAKQVQDSAPQTRNVGTTLYMAPEALMWRISEEYVHAVDIWAMGIICWQMITTQLLFSTESDIIQHAITSATLDLTKTGITTECTDFIHRCLSVTESQRLTTSEALEHPWLRSHKEMTSPKPIPHAGTTTVTKESTAIYDSNDSPQSARSWLTATKDRSTYSVTQQDREPVPRDQEESQKLPQSDSHNGHEPQKKAVVQRWRPKFVEGVEVLSGTRGGGTLLHQAAARNDSVAMKSFVLQSLPIEFKNPDGEAAMHIAAAKGHSEAVSILIEAKAEVNVRNRYKRTPLHQATLGGHHETVKLLLRNKADISAEDHEGYSALHLAAWAGNSSMIQSLMDRGAVINAKDGGGRVALHLAAYRNHVDAVETLVGAHALIDAAEESCGYFPLHFAVRAGHMETVQALIRAGARLQYTRAKHDLLACAAFHGDVEMIWALVEAGVKPENGYTIWKHSAIPSALNIAARRGDVLTVRALLAAGAKVNFVMGGGIESPLVDAIANRHVEVVKTLLDAGAEPRAQWPGGTYPLQVAIDQDSLACVKHLLDAGAMVTISFMRGTPLQVAARKGNVEIIRLLLEAGASTLVEKWEDGDTPVEIARRAGHTDAARLLEEAMKAEKALQKAQASEKRLWNKFLSRRTGK